jgi:prolipoprotein diacylglyceryltransferase
MRRLLNDWTGLFCLVAFCLSLLFVHLGGRHAHLIEVARACADGWTSQSIGLMGACSHHGGVVTRQLDKRTTEQKNADAVWHWCAGVSFYVGVVSFVIWIVVLCKRSKWRKALRNRA